MVAGTRRGKKRTRNRKIMTSAVGEERRGESGEREELYHT
jgi:hypothetical protein